MKRKYWVHLNLVLFVIVSSQFIIMPIHADEETKSISNEGWLINCKQDNKSFSLRFKSKSGDFFEDDTSIFFESKGKSKKLDLPPDAYFDIYQITKDLKSVCLSAAEGGLPYTAYETAKNQTALFFKTSDRPNPDLVKIALIDINSGKVLDFKTLGQTKNEQLAILKHESGLKIRIVRDSISFQDKILMDVDKPMGIVEDWMKVDIKDSKITYDWITK